MFVAQDRLPERQTSTRAEFPALETECGIANAASQALLDCAIFAQLLIVGLQVNLAFVLLLSVLKPACYTQAIAAHH